MVRRLVPPWLDDAACCPFDAFRAAGANPSIMAECADYLMSAVGLPNPQLQDLLYIATCVHGTAMICM